MTFKEEFEKNRKHFDMLCWHMANKGWPKGGGSYLISGQNLEYNEAAIGKQELYFNSVAEIPYPVILEIGFYAGHSAMIALIANPTTIIHAVDLCYPFSEPCAAYLNSIYGGVYLTKSDSHQFLLENNQEGLYNFLHIDGQHTVEYAVRDFRLAEKFLQDGATVIWDDWDGFDGKVDEIYDKLTLVEVAKGGNPCAKFKYKK